MDTHKRAKERILNELEKTYPRKDARSMLQACLADVKAEPTMVLDICTNRLGLEYEYLSPLLQPAQPMYLDSRGYWRVEDENND